MYVKFMILLLECFSQICMDPSYDFKDSFIKLAWTLIIFFSQISMIHKLWNLGIFLFSDMIIFLIKVLNLYSVAYLIKVVWVLLYFATW